MIRGRLILSFLLLGPALTFVPAQTPPAVPRLAPALAQLDRAYADLAAERHIPGLVYGVLLDGHLVHTRALGLANVAEKIPAAADTRFRIASMTKSFTALAIYKLRDAGQLALTDPVAKYLPEFRAVTPLTTDAAPITIHHLLTMTAGFPEDNPWGDRQLAVTPAALTDFIRSGLSLSNAPGIGYEYSNLGFALLGQIVTRVAGEPYQTYITREFLQPLGMKATVWEYSEVPPAKLALGYRWENNAWRLEPMLHDGTYAAMGGILTTLDDFARYVSFHLSAYPARDDPDTGPLRRATLREMHQPAVVASVTDAKSLAGEPRPFVTAYAHGLRWSMDSTGLVNIGHSGGLPGFGSNYRFYPTLDLAIISFANLTYAPMSAANNKVAPFLIEQAALPARPIPTNEILLTRQRALVDLLTTWDAQLGAAVLGENFFLDRDRADWITFSRDVLARSGHIVTTGQLRPENQLRGTFTLTCEKGLIDVFFTLTPEATPKVQQLRLTYRPLTP